MKPYIRFAMIALTVVGVAALALGVLWTLSAPGALLRHITLDTVLLSGVLIALCAIYFKIGDKS